MPLPLSVFISHTHSDRCLADALNHFLKELFEENIVVHYSSSENPENNVKLGEQWEQWIYDQLESCQLFLVLFTQQSLLKSWLIWESAIASQLYRSNSNPRIISLLFGNYRHKLPSALTRFMMANGEKKSELKKLYQTILSQIESNGGQVNNSPNRTMEVIDTCLNSIDSYLSQENKRFSQVTLIDLLSPLQNLAVVNNHLRNQLRIHLTYISEGKYYLFGAAEVYRHDAEAIAHLREEQTYRATHPFEVNPGAMNKDTFEGTAFTSYIDSQIKATERNVEVIRMYLVPDSSDLSTLTRIQREHLESLRETRIQVRLVSYKKVDRWMNLSNDFVLIDKYCVGFAKTFTEKMVGSEYRINSISNPSSEYSDYMSYFNELYGSSVPLTEISTSMLSSNTETRSSQVQQSTLEEERQVQQSILEEETQAQTPAFVIQTNVNIAGQQSKRLMVVLRTNGCFYDRDNTGCTMCDFKRHAVNITVQPQWMLAQFDRALSGVEWGEGHVEQIDLLTLGSFLHDREVAPEFRNAIMKRICEMDKIRKVVIESRTVYVTRERLEPLKNMLRKDQILELGIGVETTDDRLRQKILRKGMRWQDLERAVKVCSEVGVHFQAYLLIGTQTLSEREAIQDAVHSAEEVAELCNKYSVSFRIAFEPVFITKGTELEQLFYAGQYQLINLWSVVQVLRQTKHLGTIFVGMSDEGLSDDRVTRGCPQCTQALRDAIEEFNGTQNIDIFNNIICNCNT